MICGFLNAAASSGSAISLPVLLAIGLPPAVANGTNRLPLLMGLGIAVWRFERNHAIPWRFCLQLMPVFLISAVVGAQLVVMLPMEQIRLLVHIALVLALVLVLFKPQRWLRAGDPAAIGQSPTAALQILMAGVGLWAGLIVLDSGTYMLMSLVLVGGLGLQQANAVKAVMIGLATVLSLGVFIQRGQVDWSAGLPLMLGSTLGGWLGASLALSVNARLWIYRLLITALSLEVVMSLVGWHHPAMQRLML